MKRRKSTDMFDELKKDGFICDKSFKFGINLNTKKTRSKTFVIINAPKLYFDSKQIRKYLQSIIKQVLCDKYNLLNYSNILIVGLGNDEFSSDCLGEVVGKKILVTRGLDFDVQISFLAPKVFSLTGIETADIISAVVKKIKPNLVIFIDALVTTNISRLGCSFQINNDCISAGSGLCNFNRKIDKKFLGVECIVIGVPFSISARSISSNQKNILLCPSDIEKQVEKASNIIASTLNDIYFPELSEESIYELKN